MGLDMNTESVTSALGEVDPVLLELESRIDADPILSAEERREALDRAKEHVRQQRKNKAIDELFTRGVKEFEREYEPDQKLVDITIDLPQFAPFIRLDNVIYFHGCVYEVPAGKAASMLDQMARSWEHQSEIDGRKRKGDTLLTPRNSYVGNINANRPTTKISDLRGFQRL